MSAPIATNFNSGTDFVAAVANAAGGKQAIQKYGPGRFLAFLDTAIKTDGTFAVKDLTGSASQYLRSVFGAQHDYGNIDAQLETISKTHTEYVQPDLIPKSFKAQTAMLEAMATVIQDSSAQVAETSSYSRSEQITLINKLTTQALDNTKSQGSRKVRTFQQEFGQLVQENRDKFSSPVLKELGTELQEASLEAKAFKAMSDNPSLKDVTLSDSTAMNLETAMAMDESAKQEVVEMLETYEADLKQAQEFTGDAAEAKSLAQNALKDKLEQISPEQKQYFNYLQAKSKDLGNRSAQGVVDLMLKSFPNLVAPGIVGALVGMVFGNSVTGAIGAVILDMIGKLAGNKE